MIFQNRDRPQGNTNKVGNREFQRKAARRATQTKWKIVNFKKKAARRATQTKWEIVNFKKKPPAGQHKQNGKSLISKKGRPQGNTNKVGNRVFSKKIASSCKSSCSQNQGQDDLAKSQDIILSSCVCVQLCLWIFGKNKFGKFQIWGPRDGPCLAIAPIWTSGPYR